ncbi:MAG TPA: Arc family DNA-binding protein, partial [Gaiellaceae bacterium]|nr:Arc family DNA-binding protein [Gaiellaceae bacterium]
MARERRSVLVRMPPELKRRLSDEVGARGISLNDLAVGILASRFAVPFEPSGRRGFTPRASGDVLLRMPAELKERLARRAEERRRHVNDLIVETLSEGLGLQREESMASTNGSTNGKARSDDKVRVAIIGMGNCANSLLQGLQFYRDADADAFVPGLMHVDLGGYHIRDIEVVAAFDVVKGKVGVDLAEAMW